MGNLNALRVKNAKPGDKLTDGGGLRLDVDRRGNRTWVFRYVSPTLRRDRLTGFGSADDIPLAEARELASEARTLIRKGIDPIEHRKAERDAARADAAKAVTFKAYAERFIGLREAGWKNPVHRQQWRNTLRDYAYPTMGYLPIGDVDTDAVLKVLRPIWNEKTETASRLRGRLEVILSAAKAEGLRTGENPAAWRGHLDQVFQGKKKLQPIQHHAALPYDQLPAFMASLASDDTDAALLLRFVILTAARYGEAAAEPAEIAGDIWTVPATRMKAKRPHVVPLSDAALAVLRALQERRSVSDVLLFPSIRTRRPISDVALASVIKRHTKTPATTHGFRSTFRDWCGDCTEAPREVVEHALAHVIENETEAAYRRSTALAKRRELMSEWAQYCMSERPS